MPAVRCRGQGSSLHEGPAAGELRASWCRPSRPLHRCPRNICRKEQASCSACQSLQVTGVGWAATRTRLVAEGALDALNAFSFRFALPALLLRLIAGQPLRQSFNPEFYTGYLASAAIIFVLVLGTSRVVAARDLSTAAAHATTAIVSNLGFLGPPLMLAFFGERGAGPRWRS